MSVKLIKACKTLNIGMSTLGSWCERNGYEVELDPNTQISDELYSRLEEAFGEQKHMSGAPQDVQVIGEYGRQIYAPKKDEVGQSAFNAHHNRRLSHRELKEKLMDIPYSYGLVSLFEDGHHGLREYGLINRYTDKECFYHVNNCERGESIENGDFVLYKPFVDPQKGRLSAYLIRHPKEDDGFKFIFDFFWVQDPSNRRIVSSTLVKALQPYSLVHWSLSDDYSHIIQDARSYLLECNADYTFAHCCETLVCIQSLGKEREISFAFVDKLIELVLTHFDDERLVRIFESFSSARDIILENLDKITDKRIAERAVESLLSGEMRHDANLILSKEAHGENHLICELLRKCFAVRHANIGESSKAWLYITNFDDTLRSSLSDETLIEVLSNCDTSTIVNFYSHHKNEEAIVVAVCVKILKKNPGWDGSVAKKYIEEWSESMPELIDKIKKDIAAKIDEDYLKLWKYGVADIAPSLEDWIALMDKSNKAIDNLKFWIKCEYIQPEQAGEILKYWYEAKMASTKESPAERFRYEQSLYRQFADLDVEFVVPKIDSEYIPIIQWYETQVSGDSEEKKVDLPFLSKCYYLFSDWEQVRILQYLFWLMEEGIIEKSIAPLRNFTSKGQQQLANNPNIHVCFDVDLVLEAMLKFQNKGEFSAEHELLVLLLTNHADEDFSDRTTPIVHYLFDRCPGFLWRKYVEQYDNTNGKFLGMTWIERTYSCPSGVTFCEGRELEKKYEGETRYRCRSNNCARSTVKLHSSWDKYTMYDFCHVLNFDLSDVDYAGFRCENGKYLKFMTLLNRFAQFAEHLYCRECHRLMMPAGGLTNLGVTVSSRYECVSKDCAKRGIRIYLSHCFNPECGEPIDERDSAKCPNGWFICKQCATCCSNYKNSQLLGFYKTYRPSAIPPGLELAVQNRIGHLEKGEYYCPSCGGALESVLDRSDLDHACTKCGATYSISAFHQRPKNFL